MASDYVKDLLSSGEVVLVDTKQHWMALLRFALRPILIAGLGVLLALINSWLDFGDGFLGIVNDIIHWLIVVAVVVAVVWLPIDVVRWMSRHYVLTNRRAIRMDGVLRKQSFDSSLEQINDIGTRQTFLGRQLGYADLTLFTASSANETYEQLLDGLQFKKAVLDAKEGIRLGSPLQALAEDLVIRGGTNDASIRAYAKQAAAGATPAAAPAVATAATVTATAAAAADDPEPPMEVTAVEPEPAGRVHQQAEAVPDESAVAAPEPELVAAPEPEAVDTTDEGKAPEATAGVPTVDTPTEAGSETGEPAAAPGDDAASAD
jgi:membrane protein YdbS with pleckstrin-like domain